MLSELVTFNVQQLQGMYPDAVASDNFLWVEVRNVSFSRGGILADNKRELALTGLGTKVRGMGALRTGAGVQELYYGTLTNLYRSAALSAAVSVGSGYTTKEHETVSGLACQWQFAAWGEWMIASNGTDPIQVRKGTGSFGPLLQDGTTALVISKAKLLYRYGPYILAANTSESVTSFRWCSDDNVEDWIPEETNTAGELFVRDTDSELTAWTSLGDKIALYTREEMFLISYIGAPNIFGYVPLLNGFGAYGPKAVVSVGRQNYGWGRSGIWVTDGAQFSFIDEGKVREWLKDKLYEPQASKIVGFHNEVLHRIEWYFPISDNAENAEGIAYDYTLGEWTRLINAYSAALERDVFQYALAADINNSFYALNTGLSSGAYLLSKPIYLGSAAREAFISKIRVFCSGSVDFSLGISSDPTEPVLWFPVETLTSAWGIYEVNHSAMYVTLKLTSDVEFKVQKIEIYGRPAGKRK